MSIRSHRTAADRGSRWRDLSSYEARPAQSNAAEVGCIPAASGPPAETFSIAGPARAPSAPVGAADEAGLHHAGSHEAGRQKG